MPLTLVAGLGHLVSGGIDLAVLVSLLCGSLPGIMSVQPVRAAPARPRSALVLAATLILVAVRLLTA